MIRIYNILVELFGESKQGGFDKAITQYQFNCPNCAEENGSIDYKYNLEISFTLGQYHCWSCGMSGRLSKLIKNYGGSSKYDEYIQIITEIKESKYYNFDLFKDNCGIFDEKFLRLPKTFHKIDISQTKKRTLVDYLNKRRIDQNLIDFYNIGVTGWDGEEYAWRNRIIFPSYDANGDLNYFTGRIYSNNDNRVKYRNCDFDKKNIILHEDKINWNCNVYLVEGAVDCLYYYNSIALLGKTLTTDSKLYKTLFEKANADIVICLDGDTKIDEVKKIYKLLNTGNLFDRIKYIRLGTDKIPYKDFGEIYEASGRNGISKVLGMAEKFKEYELIF